MKLQDFTTKLDNSNPDFIPTSIEWEGEEIEFLVKSKSYAVDDEYIWLKREDTDSVVEGLQRRIFRMVRTEDGDDLTQLPMEDIQAFPFDLLIAVTNAINVVQGVEDDDGEEKKS